MKIMPICKRAFLDQNCAISTQMRASLLWQIDKLKGDVTFLTALL
jgi:hypothetical protein